MAFGNYDFKKPDFEKVSDVVWDIPTSFKAGMRVPGRIIATKNIIDQMDLQVFDQITNVATLPGIINHSYCMPDGHSGYGFSIGGVAAFDKEEGVISPGGIGFDINCGMRLLTTNLTYDEVRPKLKPLVDSLFSMVPAGVGSTGFVKLTKPEFRTVVMEGAEWAVRNGYGWEEDLERTEESGRMRGADEAKVSQKAIDRGFNQIGTLGSGNHYLEIQYVKEENMFDRELAKKWGLFPGQVVVMFHCGSRGFGHQVATDYLQGFLNVMDSKYGIKVLDRELASAPFGSQEGQDYFAAMQCAINMSFANRQVILQRIRDVFSKSFGKSAEDLGMHMVYDVAHNTAKLEEYKIDGKKREVLVHRKGATRSLGPGRKEIPKVYRDDGQPVIIGGSMETGSYLLVGTEKAEEMTFGSTAHGSGRTMSRTRATKMFRGEDLQRDMEKRGIYVKSTSYSGLAEEAGAAYKDVDEVIGAAHDAGISKRVVKLIPIGNVKG
ncbi:MAG: RtcB family protein [Candidatus Aenigmarchaeota archaeon]|nr:RtcB family protein [Candidatus Aenigmarchaeota archaeon]